MSYSENKIDPKTDELATAFATAIEVAFKDIDFPLVCLDWLSYNPDFHIEQHSKKVA